MSSGTNAFPAKAGFNQSGGGYFITVGALDGAAGVVGSYINTITTAPTGSGGAAAAPVLALTAMSTVLGVASAGNASTMVGTGKLLKDMGKTVISAGRTFRKFAPVVSNATTVSSFGVVGGAGTATNAGFGAFYLEVGREGQGPAAPAPIARYF